MDKHTVTFQRDDDGMKQLAIFVAQLVKEGVTYSIINEPNYVAVDLTGGY
jgi:hypothetical protein